jgi:BCD family chlorophyll transporter-like MFS transporter
MIRSLNRRIARSWLNVDRRFLPFADAASAALPLSRRLRRSLFQVTVGMALALLNGTLNRVMIVELAVPAWIVSAMISLPILVAPFRALMGFRSDNHRSVIGWRRVPYLWVGTMLQFGGFAIMPFALILLSGDTTGPMWVGQAGAALAFILVGAGMHTVQTAGLALATDIAPEQSRPRVVAMLYVMLLLGMVGASLLFGWLLSDFSQLRLIKVIQGAAVITAALNIVALWQQEPRDPGRTARDRARPAFRESWQAFIRGGRAARLLVAVGLGSAGFSMQDVLLEPYGGQVLGLGVSATTTLTALSALGALAAFALASRVLGRGGEPHRLAAYGALAGVFAFASVILAAPLDSALLFRCGAMLIGFGGGLFSVGTLTAAMGLETREHNGLALGAWGAVQATAAGLAIAMSGALRDVVSDLAVHGALGEALVGTATGYGAVYHLEIGLLFAAMVAIGPLVRRAPEPDAAVSSRFGLAEFPG